MASGEIDVIPGRVLGNKEDVDHSKLNDLALPTLRIKEGAITTRELADGQITADKLDPNLTAQLGVADGAVSTAKIVNGAVTTVKLADDAVTAAKLAADAVHGQAEKTVLVAEDEVLIWDSVAMALKRVKKSSLEAAFQPTGSVLQTKLEILNTLASTGLTIPVDDTIPQISEGAQVMTAAITPSFSTSKILVRMQFWGTASANYERVVAGFRVGVNDAKAAQTTLVENQTSQIVLEFLDTPATTAEVTYSMRMGVVNGTLYANGSGSGSRLMGGAGFCSILLQEIKG